tara:strand:- start:2 stop:697 length:696 start_codon:yes stop_codon:yes gene_type:complete
MSNKNLLNEATIRRFMKLADMEPLTSPFVERLEEMHCPSGDRDDDMDPMEEDKAYTAKKEKPGADMRRGAEKRGAEGTLAKTPGHGDVDYVNEDEEEERELHATEDELSDMDAEADREGDELEDMDAGEIPADVRDRVEDALAGALEALAAELGDSLGVDLDVEAAPEEAEMEVDIDAEVEMDAPAGDEEVEMDADAEEMLEGIQVVDDTALISEVAKRVTARLVKAMAKK